MDVWHDIAAAWMFGPGIWWIGLGLGDVFAGCEAAERLKSAGKITGGHDVGKVRPEPVVAFVVETVDGRTLMIRFMRSTWPLVHGWFGLVSRCPISFASQIMSMHMTRPGGVPVAGLLRKLNSVVCQDRVDAIMSGSACA